jgi:hypothetical protein
VEGTQFWLYEMEDWFRDHGPPLTRSLADIDPDAFYYYARNFFDTQDRLSLAV